MTSRNTRKKSSEETALLRISQEMCSQIYFLGQLASIAKSGKLSL